MPQHILGDLVRLGAPATDGPGLAAFINRLVLTRRQKASLLRQALEEARIPMSEAVRAAAADYVEFL